MITNLAQKARAVILSEAKNLKKRSFDLLRSLEMTDREKSCHSEEPPAAATWESVLL